MSKNLYVLNGPNLNLLGVREPEIYGYDTLKDIEARLSTQAASKGFTIRFLQSNYEGQLVDWIHEARQEAAGLIINPAAFTHTSVALLDAIKTLKMPVIEVHLSNPHARESFRHHSFVSLAATGVIAGLGAKGYELALEAMINTLLV